MAKKAYSEEDEDFEDDKEGKDDDGDFEEDEDY